MLLLIIKISDEKARDDIMLNLAEYGITSEIYVDCFGANKQMKDYHGSFLGSLRVIFELERSESKLIIVPIEEDKKDVALKCVEKVTGDLNESKDDEFFIALPIDFIKRAK